MSSRRMRLLPWAAPSAVIANTTCKNYLPQYIFTVYSLMQKLINIAGFSEKELFSILHVRMLSNLDSSKDIYKTKQLYYCKKKQFFPDWKNPAICLWVCVNISICTQGKEPYPSEEHCKPKWHAASFFAGGGGGKRIEKCTTNLLGFARGLLASVALGACGWYEIQPLII